MSSKPGGGAREEEYLVAPRAAGPEGARDLQELVAHVAKLPDARIIESKGSAPARLVVCMSAEQADRLRAAFGGRIIIEPNAELRF